ncbi:outer membrane beta-barrel protein [Pedobacter psychroterrae]|uniref:Outer membrane protein beta-barrel domain-containing protein n=1 Tax=Pedobacter psychroterrae TaxID=2530453 RepID=A0A4V6N611_9SPHI|nr:outer membrane beta-barrel protein [Pedobacter psychroterrae]TCD00877.1 hypothetical protein EZ437_08855 [Pedobacter psychroterrae]
MKKLILLTAVAGFFAFSNVNAQTKDVGMTGTKLGIGADFAFPMGDYGDFADFGYGGSLGVQFPVASRLNITGSAGYLSFKSKEVAGVTVNSAAIPVKAGARFFVAENFYIGGELGAAFPTEDGGKTAFAYAPGVGIEFPVADNGAIELGARYEGWSSKNSLDQSFAKSFLGLRLAYNFGL